MKLLKTLTIANKAFALVDDDVALDSNNAGRATFTVALDDQVIKPFSAVSLDIGYTQHDHISRIFLGYIETITPKDNNQSLLFCRELVGVLANSLPTSLRHPTMIDVLNAIYDKSGIIFTVPDQPYSKTKIPHFSNIASGYHALDQIGKTFKISDFFWQQLSDGSVFVGSWQDTVWPDRTIDLPDDWFADQYANSARFAAIPSLRPGAVINDKRVKGLRVSGNFMTTTWVV